MDSASLHQLALAYQRGRMPPADRTRARAAYALLQHDLSPEQALDVLCALSFSYSWGGEPLLGQEYARQAMQRAAELGETDRQLAQLNLCGVCAASLGDVMGAIDAFSHLQREASDAKHAMYHMTGAINLGYLFAYLGNADNAQRQFADSVSIAQTYAIPKYEMDSCIGLIHVLLDKHEHAEAMNVMGDLERLIARFGPPEPRARNQIILHEAWLSAMDGDPAHARRLALPLLGESGLAMAQDRLRIRYVLTCACVAQGDWPTALEHANAGIDVGQQPLTESLLSHLVEQRAHIHRQLGHDDLAWADATNAVRMARHTTFANVGAALRASTEQYANELRLREAELEVRNDRLASAVADLKQLNRRLATEVDEHRKTQADLSRTHSLLVDAARTAGMAEVTAGVVHDIGNAVNSLLVSSRLLSDWLAHDTMPQRLARAAVQLKTRNADEALCRYVGALADHSERRRTQHMAEVERLGVGVQHIAKVIQVQQRTAKNRGIVEPVDPVVLVDDALQLALPTIDDSLTLDVHCPFGLSLNTARHRVVQILNNLIKNAHDAVRSSPRPTGTIRVHVDMLDPDTLRIAVEDTGPGVPPALRASIFAHGFTTKRSGNGFGLHASALGAVELGGRLSLAPSEPGRGARFELQLPVHGRAGAVNTQLAG